MNFFGVIFHNRISHCSEQFRRNHDPSSGGRLKKLNMIDAIGNHSVICDIILFSVSIDISTFILIISWLKKATYISFRFITMQSVCGKGSYSGNNYLVIKNNMHIWVFIRNTHRFVAFIFRIVEFLFLLRILDHSVHSCCYQIPLRFQ